MGFAPADEPCGGSVDQDLGGAGPGVVVGAQAHAVGTGVEDGKEIAGLGWGEFAIAGEEVAGLADRTDDVDRPGAGSGGLPDGQDLVVSLVECGADEIVHAGVGDDEGLAAILLHGDDGGEEGSGLGDEETSGFEEQMQAEALGCRENLAGVVRHGCFGVERGAGVLDSEPTAGVDMGESYAVFLQLLDEVCDALEGSSKGIDGADLGADVDADAGWDEPLGACGFAVDGAGDLDVDAELVRAEAGGDVGVGLGEDIGVDAKGEAGGDVEVLCAGGEECKFGFGLDVEEQDAGGERGVDFGDLLPYPGEDGFLDGGLSGLLHAGEFPAGDDVEAGAVRGEELEDGERGVGLNGVADGVGNGGEGGLEELQAREDVSFRVDVEGRAVAVGEGGERGLVAGQGALQISEGAGVDDGRQLRAGMVDDSAAGAAKLLMLWASYSSRRTSRGFWPRMRWLASQPVATVRMAVRVRPAAFQPHWTELGMVSARRR